MGEFCGSQVDLGVNLVILMLPNQIFFSSQMDFGVFWGFGGEFGYFGGEIWGILGFPGDFWGELGDFFGCFGSPESDFFFSFPRWHFVVNL